MKKQIFKAGIFLKNTYSGTEQQGLAARIINYINHHNLDIFLGPEWLFMPANTIHTKREKESILEEFIDKIQNKNSLIIPGSIMWQDDNYFYNTVPVISNGAILTEHHKYSDGGDIAKARKRNCNKEMFYPNKHLISRWQNLEFLIEVCRDRDNAFNQLIKYNEPFVDLYFLVACGPPKNKKTIPIKEDGYFLSSDGWNKTSLCMQRISSNLSSMTQFFPLSEENYGKEFIHIYELSINSGN